MPTSTATDLGRLSVVLGEPDGVAASVAYELVGGKGAQTARLHGLGLPVPPAAVVTTAAYRLAAADPGVAAVIDRIRAGDAPTADEVDAAFLAARLPDELRAEIARVAAIAGGDSRVAVRSSATVEDLAGTSFAGQYRSLLDVVPGPDVVRAVRLVWASLWHPAPCAYRRVNGVDGTDAAMAVLVMAMVPAVQAGVVFTVDPSGPADHVRVEAVEGLGESLVSGAVTPRSWSLRRDAASTAAAPIGRAAELALAAEAGFGVPLDIEWAWDGAQVWLVQARPITVADQTRDGFDTPVDDHTLTTAGIAEMLPGVLPPLVWQLAGTAVEEAIRSSFDALAALDPTWSAPHRIVRRVRGRAALDLDAFAAIAASLPGGSAEAVEHGFFGAGDAPPVAPRRPWLAGARHDLRVDGARRRATRDARIVTLAVAALETSAHDPASLEHEALLGYRRRLVDLGFRAMATEVGVAAAATAAFDRLESFIASHLPAPEASAWARRVTTGIGSDEVASTASMSVFAGPTWAELGVTPPPARQADDRAAVALAELESVLRALPRWRATRIMTGQVVDVRLHLLRRLAADAVALLRWRERTKAAVLSVGGMVRAVDLSVGRRLAARGLLVDPLDVELLADAEVRGERDVPPITVLRRRRRALRRMVDEGSLPERFVGVPAGAPPPLPAGDGLVGLPASGGRCTGRARVVRDPRGTKLRGGEILVAETTDAGWSPLFVDAGAIVVERGGPLSHAAIVARELGVPAVLDVHGATRLLDGRTVTVDGDTGVVVVHGEEPAR